MKRKIAVLAFALAAVAAAGVGLTSRSANAAPGLEPRAGGPYAALVGQAIQFDGSASSGVGPLSYHWTFGDGTSASGARPVKAYAASGVYQVTLTVRDGVGATAVAATTATIGGVGYPGSSSALPNCALPQYQSTAYCHLLDQS